MYACKLYCRLYVLKLDWWHYVKEEWRLIMKISENQKRVYYIEKMKELLRDCIFKLNSSKSINICSLWSVIWDNAAPILPSCLNCILTVLNVTSSALYYRPKRLMYTQLHTHCAECAIGYTKLNIVSILYIHSIMWIWVFRSKVSKDSVVYVLRGQSIYYITLSCNAVSGLL